MRYMRQGGGEISGLAEASQLVNGPAFVQSRTTTKPEWIGYVHSSIHLYLRIMRNSGSLSRRLEILNHT
jgi:hypothetical protein